MRGSQTAKDNVHQEEKNHIMHYNITLYSFSEILLQWKKLLKIIRFTETIFQKGLFWYWKCFIYPHCYTFKQLEKSEEILLENPSTRVCGVMKLNVCLL